MGKETKIGLAVILLLLSVFGAVVYLKIYRAEQAPTAEALAGALDQQPAATTGEDSLTGGPAVQLPAAADARAPIELPAGGSSVDAGDYSAPPTTADASAGDPNAWATPPASSRGGYADVAATEPPAATSSDEVQPGEQNPAADNASAATDYTAEPVGDEPPFEASPIAADESTDPATDPSAPPLYPDSDVPAEAMQVAAEEPVVEPPAELEEHPDAVHANPRSGRRPRESAPPAAQVEEANVYAPRNQSRSSTVPANFERPDESYTIEPNDNYWRISQKLYGSGSYYKALFEHNRPQFPRADRLKYGDVISAPPIEVLERTYPELCPRPQHRQVEEKVTRAVSGRRLPRGGQSYIVEEGDTLFDIARYTLGQASRWGEIYDLNREVLGDQVDHLKPGMELILPASGQPDNVAREPAGRLR